MAIRDILLVLVFVCLSTSRHGLGDSTLSREEDLELEEELKRINKPGVKTIKTKFGDTYTCVEFHKQPAFDHPALKNVNYKPFQMRPTSYPKGFTRKTNRTTDFAKMFWVNGKGCPSGTVPIRKMSKEDLKGAKLANEIMSSEISPLTEENPGYHYAILRTKDERSLHGAGMVTSIYNPVAEGDQYSRGYLEIRNGNERIAAGWMVNPKLYKDTRTRGFVYTSAGNSHCFNNLCPGLITNSPDIPVDILFTQTSVPGTTEVYDGNFHIFQDKINKNWFLFYPQSEDYIAFWPHQIFSNLNERGNYAEWGGAVYSAPNIPSPQMGSGRPQVLERADVSAYCKNIVVVNEEDVIVEADYTTTFADIPRVYKIVYEGQFGAAGYMFWYGGLGGYYGHP